LHDTIDFSACCEALRRHGMVNWAESLPAQLRAVMQRKNGNLPRWLPVLQALPRLPADELELDAAWVRVASRGGCDEATRQGIEGALRQLHPWRKGPFSIHGVEIDTEWRSDMKWQRLIPHITPLAGRRVLDVGCGSGYHSWRMRGAGASLVVGIDPSLLFLIQFLAIKHFIGEQPVFQLPLGIQDLPPNLQGFDTVFSMGVLYHRKSPFDHLQQLRDCLRPGGELVLESLVIEGGEGQVLVPRGRYAKMRNVWFLPSPPSLETWLLRAGFEAVRLLDVTPTGTQEQRATSWMRFESLADFLDPDDPSRTVEGLPAPRRALFLARRPD